MVPATVALIMFKQLKTKINSFLFAFKYYFGSYFCFKQTFALMALQYLNCTFYLQARKKHFPN